MRISFDNNRIKEHRTKRLRPVWKGKKKKIQDRTPDLVQYKTRYLHLILVQYKIGHLHFRNSSEGGGDVFVLFSHMLHGTQEHSLGHSHLRQAQIIIPVWSRLILSVAVQDFHHCGHDGRAAPPSTQWEVPIHHPEEKILLSLIRDLAVDENFRVDSDVVAHHAYEILKARLVEASCCGRIFVSLVRSFNFWGGFHWGLYGFFEFLRLSRRCFFL